ncbi:SdrD B-like domain-containing protein [Rubripirellula amarantea]|uniref:SdrD B-like domain-containing protein n=1 Tax=Rubripirellula amarantea TaxID=2527999 RepID=UPI0013EF4AF3|nr:SdrD B-like domain-containing protein [Rubripirellula amarantea]
MRRRIRMEPLEDRRLLALLGISPELPTVFSNGTLSYDSSTNQFEATAVPQTFSTTLFGFSPLVDMPSSFSLQAEVDESGDLVGSGPHPFALTGSIDIDFDGTADVSGDLLTGNVVEFGFLDGGSLSTSDTYDFRIVITSGALAQSGTLSDGGQFPAYFAGRDIGLRINSENSTFNNDFNVDFSGGNKATLGPIDPAPEPLAELGNFVWLDSNGNGIQDDGDTGINGVEVSLFVDVDGDRIAEPGGDDGAPIATQLTQNSGSLAGYYLFEDLAAGDYFVQFNPATIPAGFEFTATGIGTDDGIDSNADSTTGLTEVTSLIAGESDLTWDAGVITSINPAIAITKYVDKIITTNEMTVLDFDSLSSGDIVSTQYPGVVISAVNARTPGAGNRAMVFDSSNPTGGDFDLGSPNSAFGGPGSGSGGKPSGGGPNDQALGNILIISEDGHSYDPDDEAQGGTFTFDFDSPATVNYLDLLDIDSNESGGSVVTLTTTSGTQTVSIPAVGNNSFQRVAIDATDVTSMEVHFVSSGAIAAMKYTSFSETKEWFDANDAPGVSFEYDETIEFSYHVTNPGDVSLSPVLVTDDNATPGNTADDFDPQPVLVDVSGTSFNQGDVDHDNQLDPGEEWIYTATIVATEVGQFTNIGDVVGTPVNENGDVIGDDVFDDDPANYVVNGLPGIEIEKLTNGHDADEPEQAAQIPAGSPVSWTFQVTNTGSTSFAFSDVDVVDDNGTPDDESDDYIPEFVSLSDVNSDLILSPGEVWEYTASGTAQSLTETGGTSTFYFNGNSGSDGSDGNIRHFEVDGVSAKASAFSRDDSGNWRTAFLGIFSGGLGVTDSSEGNGGNGTHRVDNVGRDNFVLFEFSEDVVVDQAFLDSVVTDSDLSVWIGTVPNAYANHNSLSDSFLSNLELNEVNDTSSSSSRWANINGSEVAGNILVLAASTVDQSPEDRFKIRKVKFQNVTPGIFKNTATVEAGAVSDADASHYVNPVEQPTARIGNFVWNDTDRDGKQDDDEVGIDGVTVNLLNEAGQVLQTTVSSGGGAYGFSGLEAGNYYVEFQSPDDFTFSPQGRGDHADHGSDADPSTGKTSLIQLDAHEVNHTVDAGLYASVVDLMFEAEDYDWINDPWKVYSSSSASGGEYIMAPNGCGSQYNSPSSHSGVKYSFTVSEAGNYEISGLVRASDSTNDSVWVKVDNQPWVQWHMDVTGSSFQWQSVTDGWNKDMTSFQLQPGQHSMEVRVREDGTKLDKFMVSKLSTSTVVIDATDFDSKRGDWQVEVDDDGNEFLIAENGTGSHYRDIPRSDELSYNFSVDSSGEYQMHALVSALNSNDNSFWISIDDGSWVEWHLDVTGDAWQWQTVTDGAAQNAVSFQLESGDHTLRIKVREDGTKLDKIVITNDSQIDLDNV